jgi:hypothetical protein
MTLTDEQHDRIKEIVISHLWCDRFALTLDHAESPEVKKCAEELYLENNNFFAIVNTTVHHIIEVLESPVRHDPTPRDPQGTGAQENLTQGWK